MKVVMKPSCACVHDVRYPHHQQTPKEILEKFSFRPGESGAAKRGEKSVMTSNLEGLEVAVTEN
jgi:hypothetical protein